MTNISPFKGWRYNKERTDDITKVMVPHYDVISTDEQNKYYNASPYNCVRINLNRTSGDAQYTDAAKHLKEWKKKGVLIQDSEESIYIISQKFNYKNNDWTRESSCSHGKWSN